MRELAVEPYKRHKYQIPTKYEYIFNRSVNVSRDRVTGLDRRQTVPRWWANDNKAIAV